MILVKGFRKGFGRYSTGIVEVLYWDMIIYCEVVIFKSRLGTYIKIPQRIDHPDGKKINILFWSTDDISQEFQNEVKSQLQEKFPEALEIPSKPEIQKKKRVMEKLKKSRYYASQVRKDVKCPSGQLQSNKFSTTKIAQ